MIFFFFISSSLLFSFLRFSLPFSSPLSSLVLSLLLHVSFSSFLVSFCSLFSCHLLLFSFSFSLFRLLFSLSSFFLCLLSLSSFSVCWWCVCRRVCRRVFVCAGGGCCGALLCVRGVVVWCAVWCGTLKTPCVDSKNASVCRFKTSPCMPAAWCRYTRRRSECTHGERFKSTPGGRRQFSLPKNHARMVITCFRGSPKKTFRSFPCSSLRKDREQHVPDSSNHSLYLIKLFTSSSPGETLEEPAVDLYNERFAR